jgi:hypothetical protein
MPLVGVPEFVGLPLIGAWKWTAIAVHWHPFSDLHTGLFHAVEPMAWHTNWFEHFSFPSSAEKRYGAFSLAKQVLFLFNFSRNG